MTKLLLTNSEISTVEFHALGEENVAQLIAFVTEVNSKRIAEVMKLRTRQSFKGREHQRLPYFLAVM